MPPHLGSILGFEGAARAGKLLPPSDIRLHFELKLELDSLLNEGAGVRRIKVAPHSSGILCFKGAVGAGQSEANSIVRIFHAQLCPKLDALLDDFTGLGPSQMVAKLAIVRSIVRTAGAMQILVRLRRHAFRRLQSAAVSTHVVEEGGAFAELHPALVAGPLSRAFFRSVHSVQVGLDFAYSCEDKVAGAAVDLAFSIRAAERSCLLRPLVLHGTGLWTFAMVPEASSMLRLEGAVAALEGFLFFKTHVEGKAQEAAGLTRLGDAGKRAAALVEHQPPL